jgi:hypothetical protein
MARDGSGVMSVPYPDFQAGAIIVDSQFDDNFSDVCSEITNSIPRDGQAAPTANIPFGTYRITGLGAGVAATDSANFGQIQGQAYLWAGTASGTANALALTVAPPITAYAAGQIIRFQAGAASDSSVTVAVSGLAAKAVQNNGAALSASVNIEADKIYEILYDGTAFQLQKIANPHGIYAPITNPSVTGLTTDTIHATGAGTFDTTLGVTGDFKVNTDKLVVTASSGAVVSASSVTATALIPSNSTVPSVGVYSPASGVGFAVGSAEKARINTNGHLLVGIATEITPASTTTAGWDIGPSGAAYGSASGNPALFLQRLTDNGAVVQFYRSTSNVGSISLSASATAFNTSSDARLKDNATPLSGAGDIIDRINPVSFIWKYIEGAPRGVGFLAQDLFCVVPNAVTAGDANPDLKPDDYGFRQWQIDMSKLVPYLVAEIKSLRERVLTLEQETMK